jgi:DNA-binding response OmpR family regulator
MGPSLLIVNDEANFTLLLDRIMSREGYQVTALHGSDEALERLNHQSFDLAILDIKMYPMNGVELLTELKNRWPATDVIMVSGNLTDHTREECVNLGAADCLSKPINISELKAVVHHLAEGRDSMQQRVGQGQRYKGSVSILNRRG